MESDDLNAPLGQTKSKSRLPKMPVAVPQAVAALLGLGGLVVVGWAALVDDPLGGEPTAVVSTKMPGTAPKDTAAAGSDGREHSRRDGPVVTGMEPGSVAAQIPPGAKTVNIIDGLSGKSKEVVIPGTGGSGATPGDKTPNKSSANTPSVDTAKLLETTRYGGIPKTGADGAKSFAVYAQARALPADVKNRPRIAIVIGGVGISASGTADAVSMLPASVTFALAPYATDVAKLAERVRDEGHEVLLQAPMEPFDYPDNDPGPQTLLTSLTADQNIDRLHWLMSRIQGYVGIVSYMGARFTAAETAMAPVLSETARRGLIFVDGGASSRSVAPQIAGAKNLPFAKTDIILDATPTPAEIDRALARLEIIARDGGSAVGIATAQPGTIARIAEWAKKVESRGFVLVPITMVAVKTKSS